MCFVASNYETVDDILAIDKCSTSINCMSCHYIYIYIFQFIAGSLYTWYWISISFIDLLNSINVFLYLLFKEFGNLPTLISYLFVLKVKRKKKIASTATNALTSSTLLYIHWTNWKKLIVPSLKGTKLHWYQSDGWENLVENTKWLKIKN